jgi:hypothetical protein
MARLNSPKFPEISFYIGAGCCDKIRLILPKLPISPRTVIVTDQRTPAQFLGLYSELLVRDSQRECSVAPLFGAQDMTIVSRSEFGSLTKKRRKFDRIVFEDFGVSNAQEIVSYVALANDRALNTQSHLSVVVTVPSEKTIREFESLCSFAGLPEEPIRFWIGQGSESVRYLRMKADPLFLSAWAAVSAPRNNAGNVMNV